MPDLPQDGLTLDERLFAQIALKNGLVSEAVLSQAARERLSTGRLLPEVLRARGILDDAQVQKVREAQQASLVVRLDSLYADVVAERGLVPRLTLEHAFVEQRRRRFKVRIGDLLVERGVISVEAHREVLAELQRIAQGGERAPASRAAPAGPGQERPSEGARRTPTERLPAPSQRPPAPAGAPELSRLTPPIPVGVARTASGRVGATISLESVTPEDEKRAAAPPKTPRSPLASTAELKPPKYLLENARALGVAAGGTSSGSDASADPGDSVKYLASALEARISSDASDGSVTFSEDDQKQIEEDFSKIDSVAGKSALLAQPSSSMSGESFSPDAYLKRKLRRKQLAAAGVAGGVLGLVVILGLAVALAAGHRRALGEATSLLDEAERADPSQQGEIYERASERLAAARGFGVGEAKRAELAARAGAGTARARAAAALAQGQPDLAQVAVKEALELASLTDEDRTRLRALEAQARHDSLMQDGKKAEARGQWRRAMDCYRAANEEPAWRNMRERMKKDVASQSEAALATLAPADRDALALTLKQYYEIWSDPSLQALLEEVDYRIALAQGKDALAKGDTAAAIRRAEEALRVREGSKEALDLRDRAKRRASIDDALGRAREAERQGSFDVAVSCYESALALAQDPERGEIQRAIDGVKKRKREGVAAADKSRLRREAASLIRESAWEKVLAKARELQAAKDEPLGSNLAELAELARGMVLVPAGPFIMGSDEEKVASPRRTENLPAFLIDRLEVSNADYFAFYRATARKAPSFWRENVRTKEGNEKLPSGELVKTHAKEEAEHPVRCVTWHDASEYARWKKKRLPLEAEWEKAARGTDGRTFPWGNAATLPPHVQLSRPPHVETTARGTSDDDVSPWGARDMAGNVSEWVDDVFLAYKGSSAQIPPGKKRVIRGGCFDADAKLGHCYAREGGDEDHSWPSVGFRCALDAPAWLQELLK